MSNGKISALPREIREELARRVDDGQTGGEVLPWLNGLKAVQAILKRRWNGAAITDQNLTNWRQNDFIVWLKNRQKSANIQQLAEYARHLGDSAAPMIAGGAAIAGGNIMALLEALDIDEQKALLADKPENLPSLLNALAGLQRNAIADRREQRNDKRVKLETRKIEVSEAKLRLERERWENSLLEALLKKATSAEVQAITASGKPKAVKMQQLRLAIFGERETAPLPQV